MSATGHPKGSARLPKWLRGVVEVDVEQSSWVRIPYLAITRFGITSSKTDPTPRFPPATIIQSLSILAEPAFSEDVRAVKERDSSSRGASLVGSIPTLRIRVRVLSTKEHFQLC